MTQTLQSKKVAHRYVLALYRALDLDQKSLEKIYLFSKEMDAFFSQKEFASKINHLAHLYPERIKAMIEVSLKHAKISIKALDHFLDLLVVRKRLTLLPDIFNAYIDLYREAKNIDHAIFGYANNKFISKFTTSLINWKNKFEKTIKTTLETQLTKELEFEFAEDNNILAGLKIQIGSQMVDMTLSNQLKKLETAMKEVSNG